MADNIDEIRGANFDWKSAEPFVERVENVQADIDAIMEEAKAKCSPLAEDIKNIKNEAAQAGFRKKPLNALIAHRKHIIKANAIRAKLDEDQQDDYDQMKNALGMLADLPLGQAAQAQAALPDAA